MTGLVYKLTFSNGKIYVGMTTVSLRRRLYCHHFKSKAENPKLPVHRAWKKYGEPLTEILIIVDDSVLGDYEKHFIKLYSSYGLGGYNSTPGGEDSPMKRPEIAEKVRLLALTPERIAHTKSIHTGRKRSAETCELLSMSLKGKSVPHERRLRMSITHKLRGTNPPDPTGHICSAKTKLKMSESAKRRWGNR